MLDEGFHLALAESYRFPPFSSQFDQWIRRINQLNEYAVLDRKLDTSYPMEVDMPYRVIDKHDMGDDVDIITLTIEQYMALIQDDIRPGVVKPEIGNVIEFEINSNFIRELRCKLFVDHLHNWYDETTTKEKIDDSPDSIDAIQESFKEALVNSRFHITPRDDDYVAPATSPTLDKLFNEFGKECSDITRVAKMADGNPVKNIKELSDIIKTSDFETFVRKLLHQVSQSSHETGKIKREMKSSMEWF
ncbi:hypothetical protein Tco_0639704 [Tanacetum coccineum]